MDTSNLPRNHLCYVNERKKIPGLFKDETNGRIMYRFIALRAKSYAYDIETKEKIIAKGIKSHVVKNHLTFDNYKQCLFEDDDDNDDGDDFEEETKRQRARDGAYRVIESLNQQHSVGDASLTISPPVYAPYTDYRINVSIRSFKHEIKTIKTIKKTINRFDDKRVVDEDRIHTLAHGHFKLYD